MPIHHTSTDPAAPAFGIILLDTRFPRIPGDVGNPETFSFPVRYKVVAGASPRRVVKEADPLLLEPFLEAARELEARGVKALGTSCGFLALFHRQLVDAVHIPVFTSSLLQVHTARSVIGRRQRVGIITAHRRSLTEAHLAGVGIERDAVVMIGMEEAEEFTAVFIDGKRDLDIAKCRREVVGAAVELVQRHPETGALVLECANMPPYAEAVQKAVGLPVFDAVTMINHAYSVVARQEPRRHRRPAAAAPS